MKRYVLGFAFDMSGNLALIRKERPDWQKGRWNGIGGHIEQGEDGPTAMVREFFEETGMQTQRSDWRHSGRMVDAGQFSCLVYGAVFPELKVKTTTDELIRVFDPIEYMVRLGFNSAEFSCMENVPALIQLASLPPGNKSGRVPYFTLDYGMSE